MLLSTLLSQPSSPGRFIGFALLLAMAAGGGATETVPAPAPEAQTRAPLQFTGLRDTEWRRYRQMAEAFTAYDSYRKHAPTAPLVLELEPVAEEAILQGVRLTIVSDNLHIPVPVDSWGRFILPFSKEALDEDASVLINRKQGEIKWGVAIRSADVPYNAVRLGDLRLACRITWAVEQLDTPLVVRERIAAVGGLCDSPRAQLALALPEPGAKITMLLGQTRTVLPLRFYTGSQASWKPPVYDRALPDDTLFEFASPDRPPVIPAACQGRRAKHGLHPEDNDC
ncbi:hypothetical protein [Chitinimonas naiadis]